MSMIFAVHSGRRCIVPPAPQLLYVHELGDVRCDHKASFSANWVGQRRSNAICEAFMSWVKCFVAVGSTHLPCTLVVSANDAVVWVRSLCCLLCTRTATCAPCLVTASRYRLRVLYVIRLTRISCDRSVSLHCPKAVCALQPLSCQTRSTAAQSGQQLRPDAAVSNVAALQC